jgi:integrase/recombinase XerC
VGKGQDFVKGRPVGWSGALGAYRIAQQAAGRSAGTIRLHQHYLRRLAERHRSPWTLRMSDLQAFLAVPSWRPETRKSARAAVCGFYRWAYGAGWVEHDPALGLPSVRVPAAVPRPTPEHLVAQLVRRDDRLGFMAMLAAYGGLRAGEVARVHASDLVADTLLVHGKGGKTRAVPIVFPPLLERLRDVEGWAFPNGLGGHLSPGHVSRLLSRAMPAGWTAHTLRHRMATQAYAGTRDLLAVGAVLGHSRPETTQRYVRMPDDALRAAVRAAMTA